MDAAHPHRNSHDAVPIPAELPFQLRPYQRDGVSFFSQAQGALLADEMGLGKTVQTVLAIRALRQAGQCQRALIVCPRSLCANWRNEFHTWAPNVLVRLVEGSPENRRALYHLPIPVLIATYELMRLDSDLIDRKTPFDVVVLDEAQRVKDESSLASVACRGIPRRRSWALTGTPIENRPDDIVSLFSFVRRGLVYSGMPVGELHNAIRPYFLRRTKAEVLADLPPIILQDIHLALDGTQLSAYRDAWHGRLSDSANSGQHGGASLIALMTRLKQLCNMHLASGESVKLESLKLVLESHEESGDKLLLFSQYVETLQWLAPRLDGFPARIYHGGLSTEARDEMLRWFKQNTGPCMLLVSLKAGGVGLNLQEAATVVMFDQWWNPAAEDQAMQRAHRFGRTRPLHVLRFVVDDTVEQRIAQLLKNKRAVFDEYVNGANNADIEQLTHADLRHILGLPEARRRQSPTT
jgi:SNF2 family DNA or RNA helicase